jgi:hypothetical protein
MARALTIAIAALVAFGITGCGDETDEAATQTSTAESETVTAATEKNSSRVRPTQRTIVGKWKKLNDTLVAELKANGTFAVDQGGDFEAPEAAGTYKLQGDLIRFTNGTSKICAKGDTWVWKASLQSLTNREYLYVGFAEGGCYVQKGERWIFERVG